MFPRIIYVFNATLSVYVIPLSLSLSLSLCCFLSSYFPFHYNFLQSTHLTASIHILFLSFLTTFSPISPSKFLSFFLSIYLTNASCYQNNIISHYSIVTPVRMCMYVYMYVYKRERLRVHVCMCLCVCIYWSHTVVQRLVNSSRLAIGEQCLIVIQCSNSVTLCQSKPSWLCACVPASLDYKRYSPSLVWTRIVKDACPVRGAQNKLVASLTKG